MVSSSNGTAVKATITNPDIADKFSQIGSQYLATSQTLVFDGYPVLAPRRTGIIFCLELGQVAVSQPTGP